MNEWTESEWFSIGQYLDESRLFGYRLIDLINDGLEAREKLTLSVDDFNGMPGQIKSRWPDRSS